MLIKVTVLADGHGPSEKLIGVATADGEIEQVIVSKRILHDGAIDVGLALTEEDGKILVELPRESTRGRWRIWVSESQVQRRTMQAAE